MIARSRPRATYDDVLAAPKHVVAEEKTKRTRAAASWNLLGVWRDDARVRVEPFDAIELELGALWK